MALLVTELEELARSRLEDAEALLTQRRYEAGFYLCGYAVELALKARVCKTLDWIGYPENEKELKIYKAFQSHDLNMLLCLSGQERRIRGELTAEWSVLASRWKPEMRYRRPVRLQITDVDLQDAIQAARALLETLL